MFLAFLDCSDSEFQTPKSSSPSYRLFVQDSSQVVSCAPCSGLPSRRRWPVAASATMVEMRQRRKPLVLASTQALLDSLPGDRPPPPPQEPVRLRAGVLRFPSGGGSEFGELASFVALPASALRRLAVVTGTPVSPLVQSFVASWSAAL